jgi:hypothetical protein
MHTFVHEGLAVQVDVSKVLLRLLLVGCPQPLVILDGPPGRCCLLPSLVLWHREKCQLLLALGRLHVEQCVGDLESMAACKGPLLYLMVHPGAAVSFQVSYSGSVDDASVGVPLVACML